MIVKNSKNRRQNRVRAKLAKNIGIPRMSIFRSNRHLWVQIIDDKHGKTLVSTSSKIIKAVGNSIKTAVAVGEDIASKALKKNVIKIRFDRGLYKYHGRVKALADAARTKGLKF
jgi:large subunit ribosomal protein L18